jgi:HAMP domain-containing protein
MLITYEYTRRVISDVFVAVTNNVYYLEHTLDNPDGHKATMERIVKSGTRIRSCGISFIEDYYPEKGHQFCPYAWRNAKNPEITYSEDMNDASIDYLNTDWFTDFLEADSAQWSSPFYDRHEDTTPLSAYMVPIHDRTGSIVAVLGADISLDWLTNKMNEMDSTLNNNDMLMANKFGLRSSSYIIFQDGRFITHPEKERILKDDFFSHIESCDGSDLEGLISSMQAGNAREDRKQEKFIIDGEECYVFYTPVKYTKWLMVTVVPCHAIDVLGIFNSVSMFLIVILAMLFILILSYYYIKSSMKPIRLLTHSVNDIVKGKYDTAMPELKHNDEISELRDSIENMQYSISNFVEEEKKK